MRYLKILSLLMVLLGLCACARRDAPAETTIPIPTTALSAPLIETTVATAEPVTQPETVPPTTIPETLPELDEGEFARVLDYIPTAHQALMYATDENFTGQPIYEFVEAYLRYGTVKKLMAVSQELARQGLYIKIWDAFRPVSAQFKLWEIYPDPTYVANPNVGYSSHSRGNTIDLTLVDENGLELEMPTGFDDFSPRADRNYGDCTPEAAANAKLLQDTMERHGFTGYFGEWWHFSDTVSYPVEKDFEPNVG